MGAGVRLYGGHAHKDPLVSLQRQLIPTPHVVRVAHCRCPNHSQISSQIRGIPLKHSDNLAYSDWPAQGLELGRVDLLGAGSRAGEIAEP